MNTDSTNPQPHLFEWLASLSPDQLTYLHDGLATVHDAPGTAAHHSIKALRGDIAVTLLCHRTGTRDYPNSFANPKSAVMRWIWHESSDLEQGLLLSWLRSVDREKECTDSLIRTAYKRLEQLVCEHLAQRKAVERNDFLKITTESARQDFELYEAANRATIDRQIAAYDAATSDAERAEILAEAERSRTFPSVQPPPIEAIEVPLIDPGS